MGKLSILKNGMGFIADKVIDASFATRATTLITVGVVSDVARAATSYAGGISEDLKDKVINDKKFQKAAIDTSLFIFSPALFAGKKITEKTYGAHISKIKNEVKRETEVEVKAESAVEINKLKEFIEEMIPETLYNFNVASFALAIAVANCDGDFSQVERDELQNIIMGPSAAAMPQNLKKIYKEFISEPPTYRESIMYVKKVDDTLWSQLNDVVESMIVLDDKITKEEVAFRAKWDQFRGV